MIHLVAASIIHSRGTFVTSLIVENAEQRITTGLLMQWQMDFSARYRHDAFEMVSVRIISFQRLSDSP